MACNKSPGGSQKLSQDNYFAHHVGRSEDVEALKSQVWQMAKKMFVSMQRLRWVLLACMVCAMDMVPLVTWSPFAWSLG